MRATARALSALACLSCSFCQVEPDVVFWTLNSGAGTPLDGGAMGTEGTADGGMYPDDAGSSAVLDAGFGSGALPDAGFGSTAPWCQNDGSQFLMDILFPGGRCLSPIPPLPDGGTFDPDRVNVPIFNVIGFSSEDFQYVERPGQCGSETNGWYVADNENPTLLIACPAACELIKSVVNSNIRNGLGCDTAANNR